MVRYNSVAVEGLGIFCREAGRSDGPTRLLLHGFPSSSHIFRDLIPGLATTYRVIAPDYPGFGQSAFPDPKSFRYTFERIARIIEDFTEALRLGRFALYIQDYGSPIGLRLALAKPERVTALIVQNGNAYEEGLSRDWGPLKAYWEDPTPANRKAVQAWLDYRTNLSLYSRFHEFFRSYQPPTLIAWGRYDPFFTVAGAEAYRRDLPNAELHYLETGHFALEAHADKIASLMRDFMARYVAPSSLGAANLPTSGAPRP